MAEQREDDSSARGKIVAVAHNNADDPAKPFLSDLVSGTTRIDTPNGIAHGDVDEPEGVSWARMFGGGPHMFSSDVDRKKWDGNRSGE